MAREATEGSTASDANLCLAEAAIWDSRFGII